MQHGSGAGCRHLFAHCLFEPGGGVSPDQLFENIEWVEINRRSQNSRIREVDTVPGVLWSRDVLGEETAGVEHLVDHLRSSLRWQGGPCWLLWLEGLARLELLLLRSGLEGLECLLSWLRLEGLLGWLGLECLLGRLLKHFLSRSSWEGSEGFLWLSLCLEAVCREEDKWS